jgi:hypothetical protein
LMISSALSVIGSSVPSTSRWHTFQTSMVPQSLLLLVHDIGSRHTL